MEKKKKINTPFFIDTSDLREADLKRLRQWGVSLMQKHEHKFNNKWKHLEIVTSGIIKPEDIDVRQIYPFPDLNWLIFRYNTMWVLLLLSKRRILSRHEFAVV